MSFLPAQSAQCEMRLATLLSLVVAGWSVCGGAMAARERRVRTLRQVIDSTSASALPLWVRTKALEELDALPEYVAKVEDLVELALQGVAYTRFSAALHAACLLGRVAADTYVYKPSQRSRGVTLADWLAGELSTGSKRTLISDGIALRVEGVREWIEGMWSGLEGGCAAWHALECLVETGKVDFGRLPDKGAKLLCAGVFLRSEVIVRTCLAHGCPIVDPKALLRAVVPPDNFLLDMMALTSRAAGPQAVVGHAMPRRDDPPGLTSARRRLAGAAYLRANTAAEAAQRILATYEGAREARDVAAATAGREEDVAHAANETLVDPARLSIGDMFGFTHARVAGIVDAILSATPPEELRTLLDATTSTGVTPMHAAVATGNDAAVRLLLRAAPQLASKRDHYGRAPLDIARDEQWTQVLPLLLDAEAASHTSTPSTPSEPLLVPRAKRRSEPAARDATPARSAAAAEEWRASTQPHELPVVQRALQTVFTALAPVLPLCESGTAANATAGACVSAAPAESRWDGVHGCDIDVLDHLPTPDHFFRSYVLRNRPVIIRRAAEAWPLRELWTRDNITQNLRDVIARVATFPYQLSGVAIPVEAYLENSTQVATHHTVPQYVFQNFGITDASTRAYHAVKRGVVWPAPFFDVELCPVVPGTSTIPSSARCRDWNVPTPPLQLFVGPAASGAPMHFHNNAFNALAYGRKLWALTPPPQAVFAGKPASAFFAEDLPRLWAAGHARLCVQEPTDVAFVPTQWGHAVLNLEPVVGVAIEFVPLEMIIT
jgi:Cupin-like domain